MLLKEQYEMIEKWCQSGSLPSEMRSYNPLPFPSSFPSSLHSVAVSARLLEQILLTTGATVIGRVHFLPLVHTSCNGATH